MKSKRSGPIRAVRAVVLAFLLPGSGVASAIEWPQEVSAPEGTIVVYQPQVESLEGNVLTARAAVSLELKKQEEPTFGAMWFSARVDTDHDGGIATVRDIRVTRVGWPDSKDADEQRFTAVLEGAVPETGFEISMERLAASLEKSGREKKSLAELKSEPPNMIFRDELAVLLLYDGAPRFSEVEGSGYERALNTPFVVVRHRKSKACYLSSGALWYEAQDPLGPWSPTQSPPADLTKLLPAPEDDSPPPKTTPAIVTATEPTELICTDGKPDWKSLPDGQLLYVGNTETAWLRDLPTGNQYVLLAGRWFRARSQEGPWSFVRPDELPTAFKQIPPGSDIGGVRTSVAGTEEAEEAMLEASIPQTAKIKRSETSLTVEYDGKPKFEEIPGTQVAYAVNTGTQVLEVGGRYYAVDNGVWFTAASAGGPWKVADSIPKEQIDAIPPSSPVYNTTYVNIYESTPDYVTVGYYPGYRWSFPYYGVPVYGTGWYYPPYWGNVYYPRPPTWGLHVGYNPWTGWNYGVSWSNGFFSFGVSWGGGYHGGYRPWGCCGGWYGGGYHRPPVIINTGNINIGNSINVGNRTNIANHVRKDAGIARDRAGAKNLYNRPENRARNADPSALGKGTTRARPAPGRTNDVFADRNGNVARRAGDGWERRDNGGWKPESRPENRDRTAQPRDRGAPRSSLDRAGLDRSYRSRQTGAARERARPTPRSGGGRRAMPSRGGGRRR